MHEMGIAQQVLDIAVSAIPEDIECPEVEKINLRIGKLAAVVEDSLKFCLEILSENTPLAGAGLTIETVPVRLLCRDCRHEWEIEQPVFKCPACAGGNVEILSGRELEISSIELAG